MDLPLFKRTLTENPKEYDGKDLVKGALGLIFNEGRDEGLRRVRRLFEKSYATQYEISELKDKLKKAEESLKRTTDSLDKVKKGDFTPLFAKDE